MSQADQFVITRRRKKYKFAKFDEFANCFHLDEWRSSGRADSLVGKNLVMEVGAGSALFLVELARRHPENFYIAVDIKGDRLYQGAKAALEAKTDNIVFVRSEVSHIAEIAPPHSVSEIWITFPDPYASEDQARLTRTGDRKRLTATRYLELYKTILCETCHLPGQTREVIGGGVVNLKTDNQPLFDWSIDQFVRNGWKIATQTRDLHGSDLPDGCKILTSYERRYISEGRQIYYAKCALPVEKSPN